MSINLHESSAAWNCTGTGRTFESFRFSLISDFVTVRLWILQSWDEKFDVGVADRAIRLVLPMSIPAGSKATVFSTWSSWENVTVAASPQWNALQIGVLCLSQNVLSNSKIRLDSADIKSMNTRSGAPGPRSEVTINLTPGQEIIKHTITHSTTLLKQYTEIFGNFGGLYAFIEGVYAFIFGRSLIAILTGMSERASSQNQN